MIKKINHRGTEENIIKKFISLFWIPTFVGMTKVASSINL